MADTTFVIRDAEGALRAFKAVDNGDGTYSLPVNVAFAGDIEIGAVELKDGVTDVRATINAANTARTTATVVQAVQLVNAAGAVDRAVVGGAKTRVSAAFTRPADTTAYTAKDTVANATSGAVVMTFTGVARITGGSGYIVKASILTSQTTNTEQYRLHLYNGSPTALQDNAACTAPLYADAASYVGSITFPACAVEGTGATAAYANATPNSSGANLPMAFVCNADANLYGILEATVGFTPASAQTFTVILASEVD